MQNVMMMISNSLKKAEKNFTTKVSTKKVQFFICNCWQIFSAWTFYSMICFAAFPNYLKILHFYTQSHNPAAK